MSDCRHGGKDVYEENRLELTVRFTDGTGIEYVLNRVGREVDHIEVDGVRYERVRECEVSHMSALEQTASLVGMITWGRCKSCLGLAVPGMGYCPNCGARVKGGRP